MKGLKALWIITIGITILAVAATEDGLGYNFYGDTCPQAEAIIANMMGDFISSDIAVPPRIIRMHFHDCFVRGCDGSVLLSSTPGNQAERDSPPNNPSLQGFELIDKIKQVLEQQCPGVVSCADIVTYAARESVYKSGKFERYEVRGGRKDGRISLASEALANLPPPFFDVNLLIQSFASKGLSPEEMVTLSGAHSIGVSHCSSLFGRQINFNQTGKPDPTLDFSLAKKLRAECSSVDVANPIFFMDSFTPTILDNSYYEGVLQNKGVFTSDQSLLTNEFTRKQVTDNAVIPQAWENKFVNAMIKMGEIEVLTGDKGEIRRQCGFVNY